MSGPCVLNFSEGDRGKIKRFLGQFEKTETKSQYEAFRAKSGGNTITLYNSGKVVVQGEGCEKFRDLLLQKIETNDRLVLGFDETGRGEGDGPMVICGVLGKTSRLRELRDSKKVSDIKKAYGKATANSIGNCTLSINAEYIDRLRASGMNLNKIEAAAIESITGLFEMLREKPKIIVDGGALKVGRKDIEFMVKGDDLEPVIGAASVIAKHTRDISGNTEKRKSWGKGK